MNLELLYPFPRLVSQRLTLSQVEDVNLDHFVEITSFNDKARTREEAIELLTLIKNQYNNFFGITWGMYFNEELIGTIGFYRGFENETGEVGYVIRESFRRKGFLKEAMETVIEFGFKQLELRTISAFTPDYNHGSVAALKAFGFKKTEEELGVHRKWVLNNELYSIEDL
mgnify:FL=1